MTPNLRVRRTLPAVVVALLLSLPTYAQSTDPLQVGYAGRFTDSGRTPPDGALVMRYSQDGLLVSETAVAATVLTTAVQLPLEIKPGESNTAIAMANPGVTVPNIFTARVLDLQGNLILTMRLPQMSSRGQYARYVTELIPGLPEQFRGVLMIDSTAPVVVAALRISANARGEPVLTKLPVADRSRSLGNEAVSLPHFADGEGFSTQTILLNSGDTTLRGELRFYNQQGAALGVGIVGQGRTSTVSYSIAPGGAFIAQTDGAAAPLAVGSIVVSPQSGSATPIATSMLAYRPGGTLVCETAIGAPTYGRSARMYVEYSELRNTGIAISTAGSAATLTLQLRAISGNVGPVSSNQLTLPAGGQTARYISELFPAMSKPFHGVLEITSTNPIAAVVLRQTLNARNHLLFTSLPVANLDAPDPNRVQYFPQLVMGGGYESDFILIDRSLTPAAAASGLFQFRTGSGFGLSVWMKGTFKDEIPFALSAASAESSVPMNAERPLAVVTRVIEVTVGESFFQILRAQGGNLPYEWDITFGSLPAGLTMNLLGVVSGTVRTPVPGTVIGIRVRDRQRDEAPNSIQFVIKNPATPGIQPR